MTLIMNHYNHISSYITGTYNTVRTTINCWMAFIGKLFFFLLWSNEDDVVHTILSITIDTCYNCMILNHFKTHEAMFCFFNEWVCFCAVLTLCSMSFQSPSPTSLSWSSATTSSQVNFPLCPPCSHRHQLKKSDSNQIIVFTGQRSFSPRSNKAGTGYVYNGVASPFLITNFTEIGVCTTSHCHISGTRDR